MIIIHEPAQERLDLLPLLLLADPSEAMIRTYIERGRLFVLSEGSVPIGALHLDPLDPETAEIRAVAVAEAHQGKGYGKRLLAHAIEAVRSSGLKRLIVATGNSSIGNLAYYQKAGFRMLRIELDYFTRHYPEPIIENGIRCRDRIELELLLRDFAGYSTLDRPAGAGTSR